MKPQKGVLSVEYHEGRERKRALKYRLARRTEEVLKAIKAYKRDIDSLRDIGTADGLMLDTLCQELNIQMPVGLEFSAALLKTNLYYHNSHFIQADACKLPSKDNSFDVIVATAVIEHVPDAGKMLEECHRVLKENGLCIFTTPDPFFDCVGTKIGHLEEEQHQKTTSLQNFPSKSKELPHSAVVLCEPFMPFPGVGGYNFLPEVCRVPKNSVPHLAKDLSKNNFGVLW